MVLTRRDKWCLIDADDTILGINLDGQILGTAQAYTVALDQYAAAMTGFGFDAVAARTMQHEIDTRLAREVGFGDKTRFGRSMVQAYEGLCILEGREISPVAVERLFEIGMSVFTHEYAALPGALPALARLHQHYNIAVVTKGEEQEQRRKVFESQCFLYADQVFVLPHKNEEEWAQVVTALRIDVKTRMKSWAIGNSIKSDVNPPLMLGFNGAHVDRSSWAFEDATLGTPHFGRQLIVVSEFHDVLKFIPLA